MKTIFVIWFKSPFQGVISLVYPFKYLSTNTLLKNTHLIYTTNPL